jgi:catechol 2,3-dioxygenase-like lactoylglutathione lyase family enzyme
MRVERLDHLVLTVRDVEATCEFYEQVLGMRATTFGGGRRALTFGSQKINLHQSGNEFEPRATCPAPGSADLCFVTESGAQGILDHLRGIGVAVVEGPVSRTGALGEMTSVYLRGPNENLVEVSTYAR